MTDLIAELAEVVRQLDRWWYAPKLAHDFIRTHHATLTRILTDDAAIRAAHTELVIRLGEVTEKLEAAKRDAARYRHIRIRSYVPSHCDDDDRGEFQLPTYAAWDHSRYAENTGSTFRHDSLDTAIDAAMRDSAREDDNE